jgi:hypothetical protein
MHVIASPDLIRQVSRDSIEPALALVTGPPAHDLMCQINRDLI